MVFEHSVHTDELEHEYIEKDFRCTLYNHDGNPLLYQQPYSIDWGKVIEKGIKINIICVIVGCTRFTASDCPRNVKGAIEIKNLG